MDLKEIREKINLIDKEMATLFQKRMDAVALVAKYKKENNAYKKKYRQKNK